MIKTFSISKAREQLPTLIDNATKRLDEYIITVKGEPAAVIMSVAEYESWKETMEIMSDPGLVKAIREGERDVAAGRVVPWEDLKKELGF